MWKGALAAVFRTMIVLSPMFSAMKLTFSSATYEQASHELSSGYFRANES